MGASQGKVELAESFNVLQREPKSATDPFWDSLLGREFSVYDLFAVLSPASVRALLTTQLANIRVLLNMTTGHCHNYVLTDNPPTAVELQTVTNSVNILGRMLPFVLESKLPAVEDLLWKVPAEPAAGVAESSFDGLCLAHKMLRTLSSILFRPDFALGPRAELPADRIICIQRLVSVGGPMPSQPLMDDRCIAGLRGLLACFSETLYTGPTEQDNTTNRWLQWATSPANDLTEPLFAALLNLALNYDPVGWGLPYNYLVSPESSHEQLVSTALHVLILLLDYNPASGAAVSTTTAAAADAPPANCFLDCLRGVSTQEDFAKVYDGFCRLLSNPNQATATYLPSSMKPIGCQEELLVKKPGTIVGASCDCVSNRLDCSRGSHRVVGWWVPGAAVEVHRCQPALSQVRKEPPAGWAKPSARGRLLLRLHKHGQPCQEQPRAHLHFHPASLQWRARVQCGSERQNEQPAASCDRADWGRPEEHQFRRLTDVDFAQAGHQRRAELCLLAQLLRDSHCKRLTVCQGLLAKCDVAATRALPAHRQPHRPGPVARRLMAVHSLALAWSLPPA